MELRGPESGIYASLRRAEALQPGCKSETRKKFKLQRPEGHRRIKRWSFDLAGDAAKSKPSIRRWRTDSFFKGVFALRNRFGCFCMFSPKPLTNLALSLFSPSSLRASWLPSFFAFALSETLLQPIAVFQHRCFQAFQPSSYLVAFEISANPARHNSGGPARNASQREAGGSVSLVSENT